MSLGSKIKEYRLKAGLSQEKLAEQLNISRQAVAKWESGTSSPSTANLISLASVLGVGIEALVGGSENDPIPQPSPTRSWRRYDFKRRILFLLLTLGVYISIYFIDRIIHCPLNEYTVMTWLFGRYPDQNSYIIGWLLKGLFFICAGISALPSLFGKWRFSAVTTTAFAAGILFGEIFGPYPDGTAYGHGHYGWAIWGLIYLISIVAGIITEIIHKRKLKSGE